MGITDRSPMPSFTMEGGLGEFETLAFRFLRRGQISGAK